MRAIAGEEEERKRREEERGGGERGEEGAEGGVLPSELIVRARLRLLSVAGVSKSLDEPRQTQQGSSHYCLRDKLLFGGHGSGGGGGGGGNGDGGKAWAWISEGRAGETVAAAAAGASGRRGVEESGEGRETGKNRRRKRGRIT